MAGDNTMNTLIGTNPDQVPVNGMLGTMAFKNVVDSIAKLTTPRNINGVAFDGSADITVPIPTYSNTTLIPSNVGVARVDSNLYMRDSVNLREIPILNAANVLVANIVPRTGSLADLKQIVGYAGELASATDTDAIIKFNGTTVGGDVFYASAKPFSSQELLKSSYNLPVSFYNTTPVFKSLPIQYYDPWTTELPDIEIVLVQYDAAPSPTGTILASYDGINWGSLKLPFTGNMYAELSYNGTLCVSPQTGSVNSIYGLTNAGWVQKTGTLFTDANGYAPPVACGTSRFRYCIFGLSKSKYAIVDSTSIIPYSFPVPNIYGIRPLLDSIGGESCVPRYNSSEGVLLARYDVSGATIIGKAIINALSGAITSDGANFDISIPCPAGSYSILLCSDTNTLVGSNTSSNMNLNNVMITFPITLSSTTYISSATFNKKYFYFLVPQTNKIYATSNGISWQTVNGISALLTDKLYATDEGVYLQSEMGTITLFTDTITSIVTSGSYPISKGATKKNTLYISGAAISINPLYARQSPSDEITPATGELYYTPGNTRKISVTPAGNIANFTIYLPMLAFDGQIVTYTFSKAITAALTFNPSPTSLTGCLVNGSATFVTTATANTTKSFIFESTLNAWLII